MTKTVLLVVHQLRSDPGRVALRLRTMGYRLEFCRPACGDSLPQSMDGYAAVLVFGGPMSANDDHEDFIRAELDWIPRVIDCGTPFLGICLGAQLLSRCLGGRVAPHPQGIQEIGYFPVHPTPAGRAFFPDTMQVFQWHKEGFDLPNGAELLAEGEVYTHQAFRYRGNAFALQFHPEVTEAINRLWINGGAHRLLQPGAQPVDQQFANRQRFDPIVDRWLDDFLAKVLASGNDSPGAVASEQDPVAIEA
jgi:GMP synthase (glutamine-hydrolysing)